MAYLLTFLASVLLIDYLRQRARSLGLIEKPGAHRAHEIATPVVGGIGVLIATLSGWLLVAPDLFFGSIVSALVIIAVGVWDDRRQVSYRIRLFAQIIAAGLMVWLGGVYLYDLGHLSSPDYLLYLGKWSMPLTIFATVGVINAMNMSDGMDGLAGSLSMVTFTSLTLLCLFAGRFDLAAAIVVVMAALLGFLLYNLRVPGVVRARVFLGDGGSMLLGLFLAWFLIDLSQGAQRIMAPVTALWLFALPLFDAVATMLRRVVRGKSPFHADREHYHHYLQSMGLTVNQTLVALTSTATVFAGAGVAGWYLRISEQAMFFAFLIAFVFFVAVMEYLERRIKVVEGELLREL